MRSTSPTFCKNSITHSRTGLRTALRVCAIVIILNGCTPKEDAPPTITAPVETTVPPSAPPHVVVGGRTPTSLMIWWTEVEEADSYQVFFDRSSSGNFSTMSHATTDIIVTHTGLDFYTTYYYKVRARNSAGWGPFSKVVSGQTEREVPDPNDTIAPIPSNIRTGNSTTSSITVSWDPAPNVQGYQVFMSGSPQMTGAVKVNDIGTTNITVSMLVSGSLRYFTVCSVNNYGPGPLSAPVPGWTLPGAPTYIGANAQSSSSVRIVWSPPQGTVTLFNLQRSTTQNFSNPVTVLNDNATSYTDSGLAANTTYYYRVRAGNGGGLGAWSVTATVRTSSGP